MFESGKLKISALFDIEKIPEMPALDLAIIGIKQTGPPDYTMGKLSKIPFVLFVASVTGTYDIVIGVVTNSRKMLLHIIANEIESIDSVFDSETFVVLYNTGLYVPAEVMNYLKRYDEISKNSQASFTDAVTDKKAMKSMS